MAPRERRAKSTQALLEQINALSPNRSTASDGWIGDKAHRARKSDHNPNASGVVQGIDITNDPKHGIVSDKIARLLADSRDPRIKYLISNGMMCRSYRSGGKPAWTWTPYKGNAHDKHFHLSVVDDPALYDDARPWSLSGVKVTPTQAARPAGARLLKKGDQGDDVRKVQAKLIKLGYDVGKAGADGKFGSGTDKAVRLFQKKNKLDDDGRVGAYTLEKLLAA